MSFSCDGSRLAAVADEASVLIVSNDNGSCLLFIVVLGGY